MDVKTAFLNSMAYLCRRKGVQLTPHIISIFSSKVYNVNNIEPTQFFVFDTPFLMFSSKFYGLNNIEPIQFLFLTPH